MTIVKICGITNLHDAQTALEAGADLLGFNFYPKSSRFVTVAAVQAMVQEIRDWRLASRDLAPPRLVGLFVNESVERIHIILEQTQLDYAQLHGDESVDVLAQFGRRAFRAIRPVDAEDALAQAKRFYLPDTDDPADKPRLLLDTYDPKAYGGTGKKADWSAAAAIARQYPNLLLAGGLNVENVADAIRLVRPWGVDVSSGVEATPGKKDPQKIRDFIAVAKQTV